MTVQPMPNWLALELAEAIAELPDAEAIQARQIIARGEHVLERWPCAGIEAWSVDVGPLELLTYPPEGERS